MADDNTRQNDSRGTVRCGAFFIAIFAAVVMSLCFGLCNRNAVGRPNIVLNQKINPNLAELSSLERLPGIGPGLAQAIINYREQAKDDIVFKSPEDLQKVKGIGPKKVENMRDLLEFE